MRFSWGKCFASVLTLIYEEIWETKKVTFLTTNINLVDSWPDAQNIYYLRMMQDNEVWKILQIYRAVNKYRSFIDTSRCTHLRMQKKGAQRKINIFSRNIMIWIRFFGCNNVILNSCNFNVYITKINLQNKINKESTHHHRNFQLYIRIKHLLTLTEEEKKN